MGGEKRIKGGKEERERKKEWGGKEGKREGRGKERGKERLR